jgi:hypothetical protein
MSALPDPPAKPSATPKTTTLMLQAFADLHRHEVGAEEDFYRTLPFFGTALGIVVGSLAYAAGRLPKWADLTNDRGVWAFVAASILLGLAISEAGCVVLWLSRAVTLRPSKRIGPESALLTRFSELRAHYSRQAGDADERDENLIENMRQVLLDSYASVTPINRAFNQRRYQLRASAASHLMRSLIWALGATTVIFVADKAGYLPKALP